MSKPESPIPEGWITCRDADAFKIIVNRHSHMVYATCCRILGNATEAEDATQECFEALAQTKSVPGDYLGPWLHRVATNLSLKRIRSDQRRRKRENGFVAGQPVHTEPSWNDIYTYVDGAIGELSEKFRIPVAAHFLEGQTHEAIAKSLGVSRPTVTYRIAKGVQLIGKSLRKRGISVATAALSALLGANLAEAAPLPVSLASSLGKLALAHADKSVMASSVKIVGGLLIMKKVAIGLAVLLVATLGVWLFMDDRLETLDEKRPVVWAPVQQEAIQTEPTVSPATSAKAENLPEEPQSLEPSITPDAGGDTLKVEGICTLLGEVLNENGFLVSGATVVLEIIKWYEHENGYDRVLPIPSSGMKRTTTSDENGGFGFEQIPMGDYVVIAFTEDAFGMSKGIVRERSRPERVFIRLESAGAIAGAVRNGIGESIAGASIAALKHSSKKLKVPSHALSALKATSNPKGAFVLRHLWSGDWRLAVSAPGYAVLITEPIAVGARNAILVLGEGGSVSGEVLLANTDGPVSDAVITLTRKLDKKQYQCVSDEFGHFSLAKLAPGEYKVGLMHQELMVHSGPQTVSVPDGQEVAGIRYYLTQGAEISGRVYDIDTGEGIAEVTVGVEPGGPGGGEFQKTSQTDDVGHYLIAGLKAGDYRVYFGEAKGYPYDRFERWFEHKKVSLEKSEKADRVDYALTKGVRVAGKVIDRAGNPVADAIVEGVSHGGRSVNEYTISSVDGSFELIGLPPIEVEQGMPFGFFLRAKVRGDGRMSEQQGPFTLTADGLTGIVLTVRKAGSISGRVVDKMGRPMAGAKVSAFPDFLLNFGYPAGIADTEGRFMLSEMEPGAYGLRVTPGGAQESSGDLEWVTVGLGRAVEGVRVTYDAGLSISGIVMDMEGEPVPFANIEVHKQNLAGPGSLVTCLKDGSFEAVGLMKGAHRLRVFHNGYAAIVIGDIMAGTEGVHLILTRAARLEGQIAVSGQAAENVSVEVRFPEGDHEVTRTTTSDAEGRYLLKGLPSGEVLTQAFFYTPDDELYQQEQPALLESGMVTEVDFDF